MPRYSTSFPLGQRKLKPEEWPPADRLAWEAALRPGALRSPAGPAAHLAPATRKFVAGAWGQFLGYLMLTGELVETEAPPDRLTWDRVTGFFELLATRSTANTAHATARAIRLFVRAIAPEKNWDWFTRHPSVPTETEARAARKPREPFHPGEAVDAAIAYMNAADSDLPTTRDAVRYRDGLMFAMLVYLPLRKSEFADLKIGTGIIDLGGVFRIVVPGRNTKTGRSIDTLLAASLVPYIQRYLAIHRPRLLLGGDTRKLDQGWSLQVADRTNGTLWVNDNGEALAYTAIGLVIERVGERLLGRHIVPHLARHTYVSQTLKANPEHLKRASAGLGHRSTRVTSAAYDRSGNDAAQHFYTQLVNRIRESHHQEDER
jgi:integrase/recombinase XerD